MNALVRTGIVIGFLIWFFAKSLATIKQWAAASGYQIIHCVFRRIFAGSFF